jgi:cell division GTPase FtsZ
MPPVIVKDTFGLNHAGHRFLKVNAAAEVIYDLVDPGANLIFGSVIDPSYTGQVSHAITIFLPFGEKDFMHHNFNLEAVKVLNCNSISWPCQ